MLPKQRAHAFCLGGGWTTSRAGGRQCGLHPRTGNMGGSAVFLIQTLHPQAPTLWRKGTKELTG